MIILEVLAYVMRFGTGDIKKCHGSTESSRLGVCGESRVVWRLVIFNLRGLLLWKVQSCRAAIFRASGGEGKFANEVV